MSGVIQEQGDTVGKTVGRVEYSNTKENVKYSASILLESTFYTCYTPSAPLLYSSN